MRRYDYYPFGMEIMSRSGDFSKIDYSSDEYRVLYEGLLKSCDAYDIYPEALNTDEKYCVTDENLYGQNYVDTIRIDHLADASWNGMRKFDFYIKLKLNEVIPSLDTLGEYRIEFSFNSKHRRVRGIEPWAGVESSVSAGPSATLSQIQAATDKVLTFNLSGFELDSVASNGVVEFRIRATWGTSGQDWDKFAEITNIKVTQIFNNTSTPLAMRDGSAYSYGFNGQERMDEISGSGNVVDHDGERMQDTRLGRTFKMDRQAASFPWISPYSFAADNPIAFIDPDGEKIRWFASKGVWKYRKALLATPTGREVWNNMRKTATKINVQVTDKVLVVEAGDRLFVTEGVTFNAGNLNNNGGEFSYDEATVYVSLGTQKLKNAVAANAGVDNFEDLNFKQKAEGIRSEIGTGNYDVYNAKAESTVESDAYGTVSIANDPYGGEIDVATPLQGESESEYTGRVGGHEGVHSYKDAKIEGSQQRYSRGKRQLNKEKAAYGKERGIINEQRSNRRNK